MRPVLFNMKIPGTVDSSSVNCWPYQHKLDLQNSPKALYFMVSGCKSTPEKAEANSWDSANTQSHLVDEFRAAEASLKTVTSIPEDDSWGCLLLDLQAYICKWAWESMPTNTPSHRHWKFYKKLTLSHIAFWRKSEFQLRKSGIKVWVQNVLESCSTVISVYFHLSYLFPISLALSMSSQLQRNVRIRSTFFFSWEIGF